MELQELEPRERFSLTWRHLESLAGGNPLGVVTMDYLKMSSAQYVF